jgi:hypothetical protein
VCYKQETTLGLLVLMNESLNNIIRDPFRVTPYIAPFLRGLFKPLLKEGMKNFHVVFFLKNLNCVLIHKLVDH